MSILSEISGANNAMYHITYLDHTDYLIIPRIIPMTAIQILRKLYNSYFKSNKYMIVIQKFDAFLFKSWKYNVLTNTILNIYLHHHYNRSHAHQRQLELSIMTYCDKTHIVLQSCLMISSD